VIFWPLGVPCEYNCSGCLPTGSAWSKRAPDTGLLMLPKVPAGSLFGCHTLAGT